MNALSNLVSKSKISSGSHIGPAGDVPSYATSALEIDLKTIGDNYNVLQKIQGDGVVAPVLKANAYGMGVTQVTPALWERGARHFFVSNIEEGLQLREVIKTGDIYVLNGVLAGTADLLHEKKLTPCFISMEQLENYRDYAQSIGQSLPAILYLDTGFTRTGLSEADVRQLKAHPDMLLGVEIKGVMSHLAFSKFPDHWKNIEQCQRFKEMSFGLPAGFRSLANSGGMYLGQDYCFDLSRPGKALYGVGCTQKMGVNPAVKLWGRFVQIQRVPKGYSVGYDGVFVTPRESILGTLGMGHGDSWFKGLKNKGIAYVNGHRVPFVGLVSMDLTVVDLTDMLEGALPKVGDWAELIGDNLNMDEVARVSVTTVHKILTSLGHRHYKIYHG